MKPNPFRRPETITEQTRYYHWKMLELLDLWGTIKQGDMVLDLGPKNRMGELIQSRYNARMLWTGNADLDSPWTLWFDDERVDVILALNILEHLFNPLLCLEWASHNLAEGGRIIAAIPRRPDFLKHDGHFHEFDSYRWRALVARAGLKITRQASFRMKRRRLGARPALRYLLERTAVFELLPAKENP